MILSLILTAVFVTYIGYILLFLVAFAFTHLMLRGIFKSSLVASICTLFLLSIGVIILAHKISKHTSLQLLDDQGTEKVKVSSLGAQEENGSSSPQQVASQSRNEVHGEKFAAPQSLYPKQMDPYLRASVTAYDRLLGYLKIIRSMVACLVGVLLLGLLTRGLFLSLLTSRGRRSLIKKLNIEERSVDIRSGGELNVATSILRIFSGHVRRKSGRWVFEKEGKAGLFHIHVFELTDVQEEEARKMKRRVWGTILLLSIVAVVLVALTLVVIHMFWKKANPPESREKTEAKSSDKFPDKQKKDKNEDQVARAKNLSFKDWLILMEERDRFEYIFTSYFYDERDIPFSVFIQKVWMLSSFFRRIFLGKDFWEEFDQDGWDKFDEFMFWAKRWYKPIYNLRVHYPIFFLSRDRRMKEEAKTKKQEELLAKRAEELQRWKPFLEKIGHRMWGLASEDWFCEKSCRTVPKGSFDFIL